MIIEIVKQILLMKKLEVMSNGKDLDINNYPAPLENNNLNYLDNNELKRRNFDKNIGINIPGNLAASNKNNFRYDSGIKNKNSINMMNISKNGKKIAILNFL